MQEEGTLDVDSDARQLLAVAAVIVRGETVLAMRRSATKDAGAGLWETLSGRVRPGEDPLEAMSREIAEESSLEVAIDRRPVDVYAAMRGSEPMVVIVYRARWKRGEVVRSAEHDDHRWCSLEELERLSTLTRLLRAVRRSLELP